MALPLARAALDFSRRRRRWLLFLAAAGATGYGAYRVYHLPAVAEKRRRLASLLRALVSLAEAFSASAETVGLVSDDLNRFLRGDSDEVPPTLRQLSKIAMSDEFAGSVSRASEALTAGVLRGVAASDSGSPASGADSAVAERLLDKLFSTAGSGFASVVVGSFARNLVMAFYAAQGEEASAVDPDAAPVPAWVHLVCGDKFRQLIGDCIQLFVGTAVAVYLEKTMDLNTFDEMFSGLTNPKHEVKVRETLATVFNGAVETLVRTSHQVLTAPPPSSTPSTDREEDIEVEEEPSVKHIRKSSFDVATVKDNGPGWVDMVSSTLAVPGNRSFVLDLTGRVTSESVRSFLDFVLWNLSTSAKRGVKVVRGEIVERGLEVVRFATAKSMVAATVCLALCLHLLSETRVLAPAYS
uniref:Protein PHLOEM PROTEIN 2-LIKE A10 n=1 Tax=Anthurium amnicola TaxID=1678845 RepID=A0A1D1YGQ7_9ARAE